MKFKETSYGDLTGQVYNGELDISKSNITSLEGCPKEVVGSLGFRDNLITTLDFFPEKVSKDIYLGNNPLKSLKGCTPRKINGGLYVFKTDIQSLEGIPSKIGDSLQCSDNPLLESLYTGNKLTEIKDTMFVRNCPKLKYPKKQIIESQIKANYYYTDEGNFFFSDIEKEFNAYVPLTGKIQSKGFRTLLGIK